MVLSKQLYNTLGIMTGRRCIFNNYTKTTPLHLYKKLPVSLSSPVFLLHKQNTARLTPVFDQMIIKSGKKRKLRYSMLNGKIDEEGEGDGKDTVGVMICGVPSSTCIPIFSKRFTLIYYNPSLLQTFQFLGASNT